jgi:CO/xanthine dehydrogenase Mo-binding subunit
MKAPAFAYVRARSLAEALDLLEKHGEKAKLLAGGAEPHCHAPAAVMNAINDALSPFNARVTAQPFTPERVLKALGKV